MANPPQAVPLTDPQLLSMVEGRVNIAQYFDLIAKDKDPKQRIQFLLSELVVHEQEISTNPRSVPLQIITQLIDEYNLLEPAAEAVVEAAKPIFAPPEPAPAEVKAPALARSSNLSLLLSRLLSTSHEELSDEAFESLQLLCPDRPDILEVTISAYSPQLPRNLAKAQIKLGPIQSLNVACRTISPSQIEELLPKTLDSLSLRGSGVDREALQKILNTCEQLKKLDVRDCKELPVGDLVQLTYPASLVDIAYDPLWVETEDPTELHMRFSSLLEIFEKTAVAYTIIGETLLEQTDAPKEKALEFLEKAIEKKADFLRANVAKAELLRSGAIDVKINLRLATTTIDTLLERYPLHARLLAAKARISFDDNSTDEADLLAEKAYGLDSNDDFVQATMAATSQRAGNTAQAKDLCEKALDANPRNEFALICHGKKKSLDLAFSINPRNFETLVVLADLHLELGTPKETLRAVSLLEEARKVYPRSPRVNYTLAKLYLLGAPGLPRDPEQAMVYFKEPTTEPSDSELLTAWAKAVRKGEVEPFVNAIEDATHYLELALESNPHNIEALCELADMLSETKPVKALELIDRAYEQSDEDKDVLAIRGDLLTRNDGTCRFEPEEGVLLLERSLESTSSYQHPRLTLARFLSTGGGTVPANRERARQLYLQVYERHPLEANLGLAKVALMDGTLTAAISYVEKALATTPTSNQALVLKAQIYAALKVEGKVDDAQVEAEAAIKKALEMPPLGKEARQNLALLLTEHPTLLRDQRYKILKELEL